jgi:hypothetical protein
MEAIPNEGIPEIDRAAALRQARRLIAIAKSPDGGLSIIEQQNPERAEHYRQQKEQIRRMQQPGQDLYDMRID